MVICIDVGNTDMVAGLFCSGQLTDTVRFAYSKGAAVQQYFDLLNTSLGQKVDFAQVEGCLLCCVAQNTAQNLAQAMEKLFGCKPVIFKNDHNCRLAIKTEDPQEVGTDIIASCMAAKEKYPMPCVVVDMGTATTLTAMDKNGDVLGVSILPGVFISMWALRERTGLPFDDDITVCPAPIGTNTQKSVDSGIILGNAYAVEGIAAAFERQMNQGSCTVVATGGVSQFIVRHCTRDVILNNNLLLEGLYCYYKNSIMD